MQIIVYDGDTIELRKTNYINNGSLAVLAYNKGGDEDGELFSDVSVNLDVEPAENCIWLTDDICDDFGDVMQDVEKIGYFTGNENDGFKEFKFIESALADMNEDI